MDDFSGVGVDGVAGTAARVQLDFIKPAGSVTGKLLPTGNVVDIFDALIPSKMSTTLPVGRSLPVTEPAGLIKSSWTRALQNPSPDSTSVRIHNTNTGKIIHSSFPVVDGEAADL
jgi:2-methylaconitate cis-trans-isomerase PrpF